MINGIMTYVTVEYLEEGSVTNVTNFVFEDKPIYGYFLTEEKEVEDECDRDVYREK